MQELIRKLAKSVIFTGAILMGYVGFASATAPTFTVAVSPDTVGPGSTTALTFTITNVDATPIRNASFTNTLPAGLVHSTPSNIFTTCVNGSLTATDGGTNLTFSNYDLAGSSSCTVTVDILSSTTPNPYTVLSSVLTSDDPGDSAAATDVLTVSSSLPGYTLSFSPTTVNQGAISTLTLTFDNTANAAAIAQLVTTVDFPSGLVVADDPNESTDCTGFGPTVTSNVGASSVSLNAFGNVAPGFEVIPIASSCTVIVDVKTTGVGELEASSSSAATNAGDAGGAKAVLTSTQAFAFMEFADNPTTPGATTNLNITLTNFDRSNSATNIVFSDDLNAALAGLAAISLPTDPCGVGSGLAGTSTISLSNGTLAPEGSCSFSIPVLIPAGAAVSSNSNTTSTFSYDLGGVSTVKPAVSHNLTITKAPSISLSVAPDPIGAGNDLTATFTITNIDTVQPATDIAFTSELTKFIGFPVAVTSFPTDPCGTGSTMTLTVPDTDTHTLSLTGGNLLAAANCVFSVDFTIPESTAFGTYTMSTDAITATINAASVTGGTTSDTFQVITAPNLAIGFDSINVVPGGTVNATFTLSHSLNAPADATSIGFTVDLDAALTGLTATSLSSNTCTSSSLSGTSTIDFSSGSLVSGGSCSFVAALQLPGGGASSSVSVASSIISAMVSGTAVTSPVITSSFNVVTLSGSFVVTDNDGDTDNNIQPGSTTATVDFTLTNNTAFVDHSGVIFTMDLNSALGSLVSSSGTLVDPCGVGSQLTGTNLLIFTGGAITAGNSCTFSITLTLPGGAANGDYTITSSNLISTTPNITFDAFTSSFTVEQDLAPSIVSITSSVSPLTGVAPIPMDIVFSEDIEDFVDTDITVTNGTASNLVQVAADHYTFDIISPTDATTVDVQLAAGVVEELGTGTQTNTASSLFSIDYDTSALPTGSVTVAAGLLINTGPVTAAALYSNATIHNLTADKVNLVLTGTASTLNFVDNNTANPDITIIGGTTANPIIQVANIVGDGTMALGIDPLTARNDVGDVQIIADSTNSYSIDNTQSTVAITSSVSDPTNTAFSINIDFTDPLGGGADNSITGFVSTDVIVNNAILSGFSGSGSSYTATISPIANGNVTIDINANAAQDDHGNGNVAATQFSVTNDISPPTGYAVAIDTPQSFINVSNQNAFRFSFSGAELTSQFSYTITDGVTTSTPVTGTIGAANGSFTGIDVSSFNEGLLTLSFTLTDVAGNTGTASTDTIVKQINGAPVITEGASTGVTMSEDGSPTAFNLTLNATDPESETLTWSVSSAASNGSATASGTGNSKVISYVPTADFNGGDSFTVEVTDSNSLEPFTDSIVVNVTVDPVNDQPSFSSTAVIAGLEDSSYIYNISSSDIDSGDTHTITASSLPSWLMLVDAGDGTAVLSGIPLNANVGSNTVILTVTDSSGAVNNNVSQSFSVTVVNTNDAPSIDSSAIIAATEDASYSYSIASSDMDVGDTLAISTTVIPGWLTLTDNGDGTAVLAGTPLNADVGGNNVTLVVTDIAGATDTQSFVVTVANTNDEPVFASSAITTAAEDTLYSYSVVTNDIDVGDSVTITAATIPGWLTFIDNGNGTAALSGTPLNANVGSNAVTLIVTDSSGSANNSATQSFSITVVNTNDVPNIDSTAIITATEDTSYSYSISSSDVDVGDSLAISATVIPGWLTLIDNGDGTALLAGTPLNADVGVNNVTLVVTDIAGITDTQNFVITVANTNDAPVFASSAITAAAEDTLYSYSIVTNDVDVGDSVTITAATIPTWLTLIDNNNGTAILSGTPLNDNVGSSAVSLIVTDNSGAANNATTQSFSITITNTNDLPNIDSVPITTATEDTNYSYNITASDIDIGDSLTYSATVLPGWLSLVDNGNGTATLNGTPLNDDVGANNVTLVLTDQASGGDSQSFVILVTNANDLPTGLPVITGNLIRTETVSADTSAINDDDGLGAFNYQWRRGGNNIGGATSSSYLLVEEDFEQTISVVVSYTDLGGSDESLTSAESAPIEDLDSDGDGIGDLEEGTGDSDGDGIPDYLDTDSDNDGIPDSEEGTDDSDGDGIADYLDTSLDEDGDGIPDSLESNNQLDTDGDGVLDVFDTDSDNDGISDFDESGALGSDADGDGIDDAFDVDITGGEDVNGDGIDDNVAILDSDGDGIADYIDRDSDNDSVPDALENGTGLNLQNSILSNRKVLMVISDTDGDGIMDYLDTDSDQDGISDLAEAATDFVDSDLDQVIDQFDADFTGGLDVNLDGVDDAAVLQNSDNDATPDMFDLDADNDGLHDVIEAGFTDSDLNAIVDSSLELTDTPIDSDLDGLPDFIDLDSNGDGVFDILSGGAATLDLNEDGQIDDNFAAADADADGIVDIMDDEPNQFGTRPDRDLDGVPSLVDLDDDGDGLTDLFEGNEDSDGDGIVDSLDTDSDNDGISDAEEQLTVSLLNIDSDNDGLDDAVDVDMTGGIDADGDGQDDASISMEDIDGDGLLAFRDTDTDGDGISDSSENGDFNNDGINDRLQIETVKVEASGGGSFSVLFIAMLLLASILYRQRTASKISKKLILICIGLSAFNVNSEEACGTKQSSDDICWYLGIGYGVSNFEPQTSQTSWQVSDQNDTALGITIGADINQNWFSEIGYTLLGRAQLRNRNPNQSLSGFIEYKVTDLLLGYRYLPESGNISVDFKAGWAGIDTSSNFIEDDNESYAAYGTAIRWYRKNGVVISLGYDQYGSDINQFSLNIERYF